MGEAVNYCDIVISLRVADEYREAQEMMRELNVKLHHQPRGSKRILFIKEVTLSQLKLIGWISHKTRRQNHAQREFELT